MGWILIGIGLLALAGWNWYVFHRVETLAILYVSAGLIVAYMVAGFAFLLKGIATLAEVDKVPWW